MLAYFFQVNNQANVSETRTLGADCYKYTVSESKTIGKTNENEKCFKPDISSQWSFVLLLYQLPVTKTTEKNYSLTTDSKEASYEASYESPLTRKIGLKIRNFFLCLQIFFLTL